MVLISVQLPLKCWISLLVKGFFQVLSYLVMNGGEAKVLAENWKFFQNDVVATTHSLCLLYLIVITNYVTGSLPALFYFFNIAFDLMALN